MKSSLCSVQYNSLVTKQQYTAITILYFSIDQKLPRTLVMHLCLHCSGTSFG